MIPSDVLERLIDATSIASIVGVLADITRLKAEHAEANWQDMALAKRWGQIGAQLDAMMLKIKREGDLP